MYCIVKIQLLVSSMNWSGRVTENGPTSGLVLLEDISQWAFHTAQQPSACEEAAAGEMFNAEHYRKTNSDRIVVSDNLLTSCGALMRSQRAGEWAAAVTVAHRPPGYVSRPIVRRPGRLLLLPRTTSSPAVSASSPAPSAHWCCTTNDFYRRRPRKFAKFTDVGGRRYVCAIYGNILTAGRR